MNAQDKAYLERLPEYQRHKELLELEEQLIDLILYLDPEQVAVSYE